MSGKLKIINLNIVSEGNLEAISDFFCGSGHVIPKHAMRRDFWDLHDCLNHSKNI